MVVGSFDVFSMCNKYSNIRLLQVQKINENSNILEGDLSMGVCALVCVNINVNAITLFS